MLHCKFKMSEDHKMIWTLDVATKQINMQKLTGTSNFLFWIAYITGSHPPLEGLHLWQKYCTGTLTFRKSETRTEMLDKKSYTSAQ